MKTTTLPAILIADVCKKALVVLVRIVEGWCGDKHVILWPDFVRRQHPRISRCHPLLLADLDVRNHWDAVIFTYNEQQAKIYLNIGLIV